MFIQNLKPLYRTILFSIVLVFSCIVVTKIQAQSLGGYSVESFHSQITLNQDTTLSVIETIQVNFNEPRHGIYRDIPYIYTAYGRTIKAGISDIEVSDQQGQMIPVQVSNYNQSKRLKIGDPDITVTESQTYRISYTISKVVLTYDTQPEIYWNVTGSQWDVPIPHPSVTVTSPYADITKVTCFAGPIGSQIENCQASFTAETAYFDTQLSTGQGTDFTIVVGLSAENQLQPPSAAEEFIQTLLDNLGYLVALLPLVFISIFWYLHGRDRAYQGDNLYYQNQPEQTRSVSPWERQFVPSQFSPIKGLTPAQIGTLLDESVDIQDVVAEIIELARMKFFTIHKLETTKLLIFEDTDYLLVKSATPPQIELKPYQQHLLNKLFNSKAMSKSQTKFNKLSAEDRQELQLPSELDNTSEYVFISSHDKVFYQYLDEFKNLLYRDLVDAKYFPANPRNQKIKWFVIYAVVVFLTFMILQYFYSTTQNIVPFFVLGILSLLGIPFALSMSRRSPQGHALYRRIKGLRYYLDVGQWRQEIAEKNLFLEEMLPLAISLNVVNQLTKHMAELQTPAPSYFHGVTTSSLSNDLNQFSSQTSKTLASSPQSSGSSSWSGGSGFSGSSGGGFGGGGGGSW